MAQHNIDAGRLKHRVTIERRVSPPTGAPGTFGQPVDVWEPVMQTLWAEVLPISGRERLAAYAVQGSHTHTVLVRYYAVLAQPAAVVSQWRVVHGGVVYNVRAVNALGGGRQWLVFDVEEGGAHGH